MWELVLALNVNGIDWIGLGLEWNGFGMDLIAGCVLVGAGGWRWLRDGLFVVNAPRNILLIFSVIFYGAGADTELTFSS